MFCSFCSGCLLAGCLTKASLFSKVLRSVHPETFHSRGTGRTFCRCMIVSLVWQKARFDSQLIKTHKAPLDFARQVAEDDLLPTCLPNEVKKPKWAKPRKSHGKASARPFPVESTCPSHPGTCLPPLRQHPYHQAQPHSLTGSPNAMISGTKSPAMQFPRMR
jgi:hypothetical protein